MTSHKTEHSDTIKLWVALLVLVPLVFHPAGRPLFEKSKLVVMLAITGWLLGVTVREGYWPIRHRPPVDHWIALFLMVRWFTTVRSIAPHWSLWGDPFWRNGLWVTLAGVMLFWLARHQLATPASRARAVSAMLMTSAVVAGYGILQYAGWNPLHLPIDGPRVASTQTHPVFLAAYLSMVIPLTLGFLVTSQRHVWCVALLAIQSVCLVLTASRAGWLAVSGGLAFWGVTMLWIKGRRRAASLPLALMLAGLALALLLSLMPPLAWDAPYILQTATSMFRLEGSTSQTRLLGWRAGLNAIHERPLFGYGPATFRATLEWFMPSEFAHFDHERTLAGRAHNAVIEIAVESGLIGIAAWLAMLSAVLLPIGRSVLARDGAEDQDRLFSLATLSALVAALIFSLFAFESVTTLTMFWVLAGMTHARSMPVRHDNSRQRWLRWAIVAGSCLLACLMIVPDMLVAQAEQRIEDGEWERGIELLSDARALSPTPEDILVMLGRAHADWATDAQDETLWQRGEHFYAVLLRLLPNVAEYHKQRGDYLYRYAVWKRDPVMAQRAAVAYTLAIEYSPRNPNLWIARALAQLEAGNPSGALIDLQTANTLLPDYIGYFGGMALYAMALGDYEAAEHWNARALDAQRIWHERLWSR